MPAGLRAREGIEVKQRIGLAVCATLATIGGVRAQQGSGAEVVVTAARMEQALTDAIPATTVITRERIAASQVQDLVTLLRREAGIEVTQNGGMGTVTGVFMRGNGSATRTLILIDGVRLESLSTGTMAIQNVPPSQVERIEIVRGNVSAIYGSQAMGGVIQIFTRRGRGAPTGEAQLEVGSRDTRGFSAGWSGEVRDTRFALNFGHLVSGGFSAIDPLTNAATRASVNPDADGYRNLALTGSIEHSINRDHQAGLRLYRTEAYTNYDSTFPNASAMHYSDAASENLSAYWNARWTGRWRTSLTLARARDSLRTYTNGVSDSLSSTVNHQWQLRNQFALADGHHLNFDYESQRAGIDSSSNFVRRIRNIESVAAGYNGVAGIAELQLNHRRDAYSDFGRKESTFGGIGLNVAQDWKVLLSASTAFRAPNFNEMFFPVFGNPNVRPERARSKEAALQWSRGTHLARIAHFDTVYTDFIAIFPIVNIPGASIRGVELTYSGTIAGYDIRASATEQNPLDQAANAPLIRQSRRFANLSVSRRVGAWSLGLDWRGNGERRDNAIGGTGTLESPAFRVLDLTARYSIDRAWSIGARLENAADQRYMIAHGYNTPRRGLFVTLAYRPQ